MGHPVLYDNLFALNHLFNWGQIIGKIYDCGMFVNESTNKIEVSWEIV